MKIVGKVNIESLSEFEVSVIKDLRGGAPYHVGNSHKAKGQTNQRSGPFFLGVVHYVSDFFCQAGHDL